jgi:uncharacterized protein
MSEVVSLLALGVVAGMLSGLVGIGGGVIIVPALVLLFGLSEHQAQGTTLALLVPPIGLAAAWVYYRDGYVNLKFAALICAGFIVGSLLGAHVATGASDELLRKIFGFTIVAIGLRMIFFK